MYAMAFNENKELNRSFMEMCPDGMFITCEGKIVFVNDAFINLMGAKSEVELVGLDVTTHIKLKIEHYKNNGIIEGEYVRIDGRSIDVEVTARPFTFEGKKAGLVIVRKIGMRKLIDAEILKYQEQMEELVKDKTISLKIVNDKLNAEIAAHNQMGDVFKESEERFSSIFRNSPDAMAFFALSDGCVIDVNDSYTRITGYERNEVMYFSIEETKGLVKAKDWEAIVKMISQDRRIKDLEIQFITKTGVVRLGLLSGQIISLDNQESVFVSFRDITDSKRLENEVSRFDQLSLVGEMAAGIAHEIRNPMTTVRGFLQMFGQKEAYTNDRQFFDLMIEELDRASTIITEFLSLAKSTEVEFKCQNINDIIETMMPLIWSDAMVFGSNVKFELSKIRDTFMDGKEIRQLILNLARNGLEAMPSGGRLIIKTYEDAKGIFLEVMDEGKGISPEVMDKIGSPFFTTKENGTGLGLVVCYSIVAKHNGEIKIDTSPKGTKFIVKFKGDNKNIRPSM